MLCQICICNFGVILGFFLYVFRLIICCALRLYEQLFLLWLHNCSLPSLTLSSTANLINPHLEVISDLTC